MFKFISFSSHHRKASCLFIYFKTPQILLIHWLQGSMQCNLACTQLSKKSVQLTTTFTQPFVYIFNVFLLKLPLQKSFSLDWQKHKMSICKASQKTSRLQDGTNNRWCHLISTPWNSALTTLKCWFMDSQINAAAKSEAPSLQHKVYVMQTFFWCQLIAWLMNKRWRTLVKDCIAVLDVWSVKERDFSKYKVYWQVPVTIPIVAGSYLLLEASTIIP